MSNSYSIRSVKIRNGARFGLPAEFYRRYPQFTNVDGWIELLSLDTVILQTIFSHKSAIQGKIYPQNFKLLRGCSNPLIV